MAAEDYLPYDGLFPDDDFEQNDEPTGKIKMSQIWRQQSFEVLQLWIDCILDEASDNLTQWETTFIEDISIRVNNKWPLTERQEKTLEKIYSEKTS